MVGKFIDLHTHSNASDGTDTPTKLIEKAASLGLYAIALTDHDTIEGLEEAQSAALQNNIRLIRGCELAVVDYPYGELHILGLWMPQSSERIHKALEDIREHRRRRNEKMLNRLADLGMALTMDEVLAFAGGSAAGRPHIALALKERGYVKSVNEAFEKYISFGCPAFVPRTIMTPEEGIGLLAEEGATVALAHPFLQANMSASRLNELLRSFKKWGLTALETYHSAHTPKDVRKCLTIAERHGLLSVGGSDYHGSTKPGVLLGTGRGGMRVPVRVLELLEEQRSMRGLPV